MINTFVRYCVIKNDTCNKFEERKNLHCLDILQIIKVKVLLYCIKGQNKDIFSTVEVHWYGKFENFKFISIMKHGALILTSLLLIRKWTSKCTYNTKHVSWFLITDIWFGIRPFDYSYYNPGVFFLLFWEEGLILVINVK